jgi:hypothetical protein
MNFIIRKAKIGDTLGVIHIVKQVWGEDDFVSDQFITWIKNPKENYTLVALERDSKEYCAIGNIKKMANTVWLEGLRIVPKFRGYKLATKMTENLIQAPFVHTSDIKLIGFATGKENLPMHKVAEKFNFNVVGEQVVLYKEKNKESELFIDLNNYKKVSNISELYEKLNLKYKNNILTSFFKLPNNDIGWQIFQKMQIFESNLGLLIFEQQHNETTEKRGIFTFFPEKKISTEKLFTELKVFESLDVVKRFNNYSFSIPVQDLDYEQVKNYNSSFEFHALTFFEKMIK